MWFLVIQCAMVATIGASASTLAQTNAVPASPQAPMVDMPTTGPVKVLPAPIGHRQPRAKDLPSEVNQATTAPTPKDKELDQKLRICRGC